MEIPPQEERLCKIHNKPITPYSWKNGYRNKECSKCINLRCRSLKNKKRRSIRWNQEFISCVKHVDRRCNKSAYVAINKRKCGSCTSRLSAGVHRPSHIRGMNKQVYKRSIKRRNSLKGKLFGLRLFERSTGMDLSALGLAR